MYDEFKKTVRQRVKTSKDATFTYSQIIKLSKTGHHEKHRPIHISSIVAKQLRLKIHVNKNRTISFIGGGG